MSPSCRHKDAPLSFARAHPDIPILRPAIFAPAKMLSAFVVEPLDLTVTIDSSKRPVWASRKSEHPSESTPASRSRKVCRNRLSGVPNQRPTPATQRARPRGWTKTGKRSSTTTRTSESTACRSMNSGRIAFWQAVRENRVASTTDWNTHARHPRCLGRVTRKP